MTMKKFFEDLKRGQVYEKMASNYFKYSKIHYPKGKFSYYDFIIDDKIKVEVKSDRIAGVSGNFAIEYECRGKPSGINITQADFYLYFIIYPDDKHCVYKIPVEQLKKISKEKGRKIKAGDDNASRIYLLHKHLLKDYLIEKRPEVGCLFI